MVVWSLRVIVGTVIQDPTGLPRRYSAATAGLGGSCEKFSPNREQRRAVLSLTRMSRVELNPLNLFARIVDSGAGWPDDSMRVPRNHHEQPKHPGGSNHGTSGRHRPRHDE